MPTWISANGLVDVDGATLINDACIVIDGDRIVSVGPRGDMPKPEYGDEVFDFSRHYLLPGLINSHAHLCLPSGGKPFHFEQSDRMALLNAVANMQTELHSGVTTLRDCGDQNGVLFSLRQAIEERILTGPRLVLCGPPLTPTDGHAHFLGGQADGPGAVRNAVRQRIEAGADFIKLIATGGSTPGTDPARASYSTAEMAAAVDTAHQHGKPVAAHCRGTPGIRSAVEAGVDQIEHACFELPDGRLKYDPDLAEQIKRSGIVVTPTIQLYRDALDYLQQKQTAEGLTSEEFDRLQRSPAVIAEKYRTLKHFIELGIRCVAGSDAGLPQTGFGCFWKEMDAMICGGMTPMQAIISATRTAAEAMRMDDTIGSIRVGKRADLLVVEDNPLEDISALQKVHMVMKNGAVVFEERRRLS